MAPNIIGHDQIPIQPSSKERAVPFVFRGARRYLRDSAYPLPVDLRELNRQNLRMLLLMQVFGTPFCSKLIEPPRKVLEIACGTALWSLSCHEYFKQQGYNNVSFTGLDIAPLAPDLQKQGVNWRFVQHDLRKPPMPFEEGEFDLIFIHDGMTVFAANAFAPVNPLAGLKKYLKPGGVGEIWEADFVFRCLLPSTFDAPRTAPEDLEQARRTATYAINAATPFTKAQNQYLQDYNQWLEAGFHNIGLSVTPCAVLLYGITTEAAEEPSKAGCRRIAIPLSPCRWESENSPTSPDTCSQPNAQSKFSTKPDCVTGAGTTALAREQAAIRSTALQVTVSQIEALEPLLMEQSGMKEDEWHRWWSCMTSDLLENEGASNGECLEVIASWVRK